MNQSAGAPAVLDSPDALRAARRLRAWQLALEALVAAGLAAALVLTGGRAPWALPAVGLAAVATAAARARASRRALDVFGPCRVVLHRSGLGVAVEPATWHARDWPLNLGAPAWPVAPLLGPGVALLALGLLQLTAAAFGRETAAPAAVTRHALVVVLAVLMLHAAAAAALASHDARRRFRRVVAWLGAAAGAAAALAPTGERPAGFPTLEHLAGYLALALPVSLSRVADAWRAYRARLGSAPGVQRWILVLSRRDGWRILEAGFPACVAFAGLVATGAPGALLSIVSATGLALAGRHGRRRGAGWVAALLLTAAALVWIGLVPFEAREAGARVVDASGPRLAWSERLGAMSATAWLVGSGLGSSPASLPGWLALFADGGLAGVAIATGAALVMLRRARHSPWLLVGLLALVLHGLVRLDAQAAPTAALLAALASLPERHRRANGVERHGGRGAPDETLPPPFDASVP